MAMWPKYHIWNYKTRPKHIFDKMMWLLLRPIMITLAHGKISHWWHWREIPLKKDYKGIKLTKNPEAFEKKGHLDQIRMSLGGWQMVYILEPVKQVDRWQYGFFNPHTNMVEKCSIILEGPIRILIGPGVPWLFGFDLSGKEITLKASTPHIRHDRSYRHFPIV
jgi:hypothetical protein